MTTDKETEVAEVKPKTKYKNLTPKQWAEVEAIWEAGMMTRKTLAEKFGITERSIQRHMSEKKIARGAKTGEHRDKINKELEKASVDDAAILAARIRETKEEHYKMVTGLGKLSWQEVVDARQKGLPFSTMMNNQKALNAALSNIALVRAEKWAILGLDKDDFIDEEGLPELLITELTADQVEALRSRDLNEFEELPEDGDGGIEDDEVINEEEDDSGS